MSGSDGRSVAQKTAAARKGWRSRRMLAAARQQSREALATGVPRETWPAAGWSGDRPVLQGEALERLRRIHGWRG